MNPSERTLDVLRVVHGLPPAEARACLAEAALALTKTEGKAQRAPVPPPIPVRAPQGTGALIGIVIGMGLIVGSALAALFLFTPLASRLSALARPPVPVQAPAAPAPTTERVRAQVLEEADLTPLTPEPAPPKPAKPKMVVKRTRLAAVSAPAPMAAPATVAAATLRPPPAPSAHKARAAADPFDSRN